MEGYFHCLCDKGRLLLIEKQKVRRSEGFKESSGEKTEDWRVGRLEGWRVGGLAKHLHL